jgi:hypothetical protein
VDSRFLAELLALGPPNHLPAGRRWPELQSHHSVKSWSKESRKSAIHDAYLNGTLSPGSDANNATTLPEGYTQHAKEVAERIKALDSSISRPAAERYPETIYLQQVSGVGPITSLYFVQSRQPWTLSANATLEPSWACVRSGIKAERLTRNYPFPNAETDTCDVCWNYLLMEAAKALN